MKFHKGLRVLMLGAAGAAIIATNTLAADLTPIMPTMQATPVTTTAAPTLNWAGPYAGVSGGALFCGGVCWSLVSLQAGYNFVRGNILFGAEGLIGLESFSDLMIQANARAGYIFGRALVYAEVGVGAYPPGNLYVDFGGGIEVALGRHLSIFAEAKGEWPVLPIVFPRVEVGLNWHFGG